MCKLSTAYIPVPLPPCHHPLFAVASSSHVTPDKPVRALRFHLLRGSGIIKTSSPTRVRISELIFDAQSLHLAFAFSGFSSGKFAADAAFGSKRHCQIIRAIKTFLTDSETQNARFALSFCSSDTQTWRQSSARKNRSNIVRRRASTSTSQKTSDCAQQPST